MHLIAYLWLSIAHAEPPIDPNEVYEPGDVATAEASLPKPGTPPPAEQVDDLTRDVASGLRCPVCQGLSVADSPSKTAVTMKHRVKELVANGYTEDQIQAYFIARYGEWVLLEPRVRDNWLVWLAPAVLAAAGLAWAGATVTRWRKPAEPAPSPATPAPGARDEYEQKLLAEIDE